jgi:hypothetical protein
MLASFLISTKPTRQRSRWRRPGSTNSRLCERSPRDSQDCPRLPLPRTTLAGAASPTPLARLMAWHWPCGHRHGPAGAMTWNCGATTARAGARSSSKAVSSTRSPRMPVRPGREARGRRCSARPGMPYENLRARMLRRAIGLPQTSHHDKCVNDGPTPARL